jgi:large subunit ribosomal protein L25
MAERPSVKVQDRELFGKKVRRLRLQGLVPVNFVIPGADSRALQTDERQLVNVLKQTGQSGLIELKWQNADDVALIGEVHVHPVTRRVLHVAFRKIDLTKPIDAAVPLEFVGVAVATLASDRFVVNEILEVDVRCLPDVLPKSIEVDVSSLDQVGDVVRVSSITPPDGVEILNDPEQVTTRVEFERAEEEIEVEEEFGLDGEIADVEGEGEGEDEAEQPDSESGSEDT